MNVADSDALTSLLEAEGHAIADAPENADVIVLNTCSVRQKAETRVFGRLGELSSLKRKQDVRFVVAGCMAQRLGEQIIARMPYVELVVGPDDMTFLPELLRTEACGVVTGSLGRDLDGTRPVPRSNVSAFVPIARGCDNYCSYCIVPYVRGPERCRPLAKVVEECRTLAQRGVSEVTLLGQNVNSYSDDGRNFAALLRAVNETSGLKRIRFMTSHPKDLSDELIETIADGKTLCEHVHLPLQSGHDRTLSRMNRGYTVERYLRLVERIREAIPGVALTTDIIAGFPGETETEFEATLSVVERIGFDSAFTFRYSVREGTAAASFLDDVPEKEKIARLTRLIELQKSISQKRNERRIGETVEVLVDARAKRGSDRMRGRTRTHHTVLFPGMDDLMGKILDVRITGADPFTLFGEVVEN
jgi:tRNA-2-methylthio-N6-dimethylallyladenosine synthase